MRIFFTLILCTVLVFTHTHTSFDLTAKKAAGAAIITVVAGGILYLVKTNIDQTQQIAELEEASQNLQNAFILALTASSKIRIKLLSANSLRGGIEQDPVTFQDLEALVNYGQAMERAQRLLIKSNPSKISLDLK